MSPLAVDGPIQQLPEAADSGAKTKKCTGVHFSPTSTLYRYFVEEGDEQEQWYSDEDLQRFHANRLDDLRAVRIASTKVGQSAQCIIGLESWLTDKSIASSMLRKRRFLCSVLNEQDEQWAWEHLADPERIATICITHSDNTESRSEAHARGAALYNELRDSQKSENRGSGSGKGVARSSSLRASKNTPKSSPRISLGPHFQFRLW